MKIFLSALVMLFASLSFAYAEPLLVLNDPKDDDIGDGSLTYPFQRDYQKGDLDLLSLEITKTEDGCWFTVRFSNKIRHPSTTELIAGPEPLDTVLRKEFYAFNLDIYIDTDRINNSGNTFTLPGRNATISNEYAWEKAIILSPRPEQIQQQLSDILIDQFRNVEEKNIIEHLQQSIFFPTKIKVSNYNISFFVPDTFIKPDDIPDASLVTFVTAAQKRLKLDWSPVKNEAVDINKVDLGVLPVVSANSSEYFSTNNRSKKASPIVDLLAANIESQKQQLANPDKVQLIGNSHSVSRTQDNAIAFHSFAELLGAQEQARNAEQTNSIVNFPLKEKSQTAPDNNIVNRLKKLEELKQQFLITEEEYQQHRARILNEL